MLRQGAVCLAVGGKENKLVNESSTQCQLSGERRKDFKCMDRFPSREYNYIKEQFCSHIYIYIYIY